MKPTRLLANAAQATSHAHSGGAAYTPLIKFKGHHAPPANVDHSPAVHPASPHTSLPDSFTSSFASYRQKVQQHGPLGGHKAASNATATAAAAGQKITYDGSSSRIGARPGSQLGSVNPEPGMLFDRSELPARFQRLSWAEGEAEAVDSAGASMW